MKYVVLTMGILFCLTSAMLADEVVYDASQDTEVDEQLPGINSGEEPDIEVHADWEDDPVWIVKGMFEFPVDIPEGATVEEAVLQLHVLGNSIDPGPLDIFRVDGPWAEMTVTWDNRPGENRDLVVSENAPEVIMNPVLWEIDVTHIVQSWVDGFPNNGFYLDVPDNNNWVDVDLATKEHPDADIRPNLYINWWINDVEEAAVDNMTLSVSPISVGSAAISFSLSVSTSATLSIYDASGALVQTLVNGSVSAGNHQLTWNPETPGVYFVRLEAGESVFVRKAVVLR